MPRPEGAQVAHATEALRPGAAQEFQQDRFGLIVPMVAEHEIFAVAQIGGKRPVTRLTRRRLGADTTTGVDRHGDDLAWNLELTATISTMLRPRAAVGMQAVIDMQCTQPVRPGVGQLRQRVQQRGGIGPATEGYTERGPARQRGQGGFEAGCQRVAHFRVLRGRT